MNSLTFSLKSLHKRLGRINNLFAYSKFSFASKAELEKKLNANIKIDSLEVADLSGDCGTSFSIKIKSPDFNGKNMIAQHRIVNTILKEELKDIHALQLKTEGSNK